MDNARAFLERCSELLGAEHVLAGDRCEQNLNDIRREVIAELYPACTEDVQQIVRWANQVGVRLYAVSRGMNWGLGTKTPTCERAAVVNLSRMNRVVRLDHELRSVRVEAGVSQAALAEHLAEHAPSLYIPVTGAPPESSVIGNYLERGDGIGPGGERMNQVCSLTVVLGTGELIHTGMAAYARPEDQDCGRWGLGPSLDGLFSQSNLGIVVEATFWLQERPRHFQSFLGFVKDTTALGETLVSLRELQARGLLRENSFSLWNGYKMIASERQFPWQLTKGQVPLTPEQLASLDAPWRGHEWILMGALYADSFGHGRIQRRLVKRALRGSVRRLLFVGPIKARLIAWLAPLLTRLMHTNVREAIDGLYYRSVFLGNPTRRSSKTLYWRKQLPVPADIDPIRDRCGLNWICLHLPFRKEVIEAACDEVTRICLRWGFEPQIAMVAPNPRSVFAFPTVVYDRSLPGEAEKCLRCNDEVMQAMRRRHIYPYRLGLQSMKWFPPVSSSYARTLSGLAAVCDPHGTLAPGRYDLPALEGVADGEVRRVGAGA